MVIVICCDDLYDTAIIIYYAGSDCNVNFAPIVASIELHHEYLDGITTRSRMWVMSANRCLLLC